MSVNVLNKLRTRDKMWGFAKYIMTFSNEFNKFNHTAALIL